MKSASLPPSRVRLLVILSAVGAILAPTARGQVSFFTPPTYTIGDNPVTGIFAADYNGKPGILVSNGTMNLGNGDGTFTLGVPVSGTPLAVADFNGDGKPDVLESSVGALDVLLGKGDGTFQAAISTNIGATVGYVAAFDLNGDGKADVVNVSNNALSVYLSKGDGSFSPAGGPYNIGAIPGPPFILFGDFNGDHKMDVAVVTFGAQATETVLLGNGDGTFQSTPLITTGISTAQSVVVGDFNGDGKLDIATLGSNSTTDVVFLQLGNGDGTFQAPTQVASYMGPHYSVLFGQFIASLATADLNGDGKLDLVLAEPATAIFFGNGDGTFSPNANYYLPVAGGSTGYISIADFNLDGKPDIAASGEVLLNNGKGGFMGETFVLLGANLGVVADFTKTGIPYVAAAGNTNLYILANDGSANLTLAHTYTLQQAAIAIATADLNGDGNLDLIVAGTDPTSHNWSYSVLLGNGDGSFQPPILYQQNVTGGGEIVLADFNHDHKLDLAVPVGTQSFALLLGNGDGTFGPPNFVFDGDGGSIVSADFNGDGKLDMAEAGPSGLAILLGNGDGTFQPASFPFTTPFFAPFTADLNGDGKADLITNILSVFSGSVQPFLGNGDGTFKPLSYFPVTNTGYGVSTIALADLNGDGKLDVISADYVEGTSHGYGNNGIYFGNGDGTFDSNGFLIPYGNDYPANVQAADMNGDGKRDLIVEDGSTVYVIVNTTTNDFAIAPAPGSPNSATITAGQSASFNLAITPSGAFSGTVNLSCTVTPAMTPAPMCTVPAAVNVALGTAAAATVKVSTTMPVTTGTISHMGFPPGAMPLAWTTVLLVSGLLFVRRRRLVPAVAAPIALLAIVSIAACGGGSTSSTSHMTPGTPAGTYTATITATAGSLKHATALTIVVH